jgi:outer membrane protein W
LSSIILEGPTISFYYAWPGGERETPSGRLLRPYAGLGLTYFFARFDHEGWWHYGFLADRWQDAAAAYDAWRITGIPENPNGGYRRNMDIDDSIGLAATAGCDVRLTGHLRLDLLARYIRVKVDATYVQSTAGVERRTKSSTFDMTAHTLGLGLRYAF